MVKAQYTTHGIEIGVPVPRIRLEVVALGPLVPGFQEDDGLLLRPVADDGCCLGKMACEKLWCRIVVDDTVLSVAGRVIPAGQDLGKKSRSSGYVLERIVDDIGVFKAQWALVLGGPARISRGKIPGFPSVGEIQALPLSPWPDVIQGDVTCHRIEAIEYGIPIGIDAASENVARSPQNTCREVPPLAQAGANAQ